MSVGVIVCAAGRGTRANLNTNKMFAPLQGQTVIERALSAFAYPDVQQIVVTAAAEEIDEMQALCSPFGAQVVVGGETRTQSVYNALEIMHTDIVLIHDGARPFVTRTMIENCILSVRAHGSGICAIKCTDTIAQTDGMRIIGVPDRNQLRIVQTPQGFWTADIRKAYQQAFANGETSFTDDSSVYTKYCGTPTLCEGDIQNKKLTYAHDFQTAIRCGFGIDTHAFGKPQAFVTLCGVQIPCDSGLIAHSDGDVVVHALMDALLSAAGLQDIGHYFPDSSKDWENASSLEMLKIVLLLLREQGYAPQNVSLAIQAEKPRLAKYIPQMQKTLAESLGIDQTAVGISAGTCEGLGFIGEGKGITANAFVLIKEK